MKSKKKKKVIGVFNGSFLSNLVRDAIAFLIFLKEPLKKKIAKFFFTALFLIFLSQMLKKMFF